MPGRVIAGSRFWAVTAGPPGLLDLDPPVGPFVRAVLELEDPTGAVVAVAHGHG